MTDYIIDINGQEILIENVQSDYRTRFGSQLRDVRTGLGITQSALSRMADIERSNITRIENGQYNLSLGLMVKLARALGKDLEIRFTDRD